MLISNYYTCTLNSTGAVIYLYLFKITESVFAHQIEHNVIKNVLYDTMSGNVCLCGTTYVRVNLTQIFNSIRANTQQSYHCLRCLQASANATADQFTK